MPTIYVTIEVAVECNYTPAIPAYTSGHPDRAEEGWPEQFEITDLDAFSYKQGRMVSAECFREFINPEEMLKQARESADEYS